MLPMDKIIQFEEARAAAWMTRDKDAIRDQLHDNSQEINIYGRFTKQQILDDLFPKVQMLKFQMSRHKVLYAGPESCVLNYRVDEQIKSDGRVLSFDCYVTAIYKKEGRRWLLLLWQITPLTR